MYAVTRWGWLTSQHDTYPVGLLLSRLLVRGPRGGPRLEMMSKSPASPSAVGRLPSELSTIAGLWLYFDRCSFRLWQYLVAYVQSAHLLARRVTS